jgi:hypothetical protein
MPTRSSNPKERAFGSLLRTSKELQGRLEGALGGLPRTAEELYEEICAVLQAAVRAEHLTNAPYEIKDLVRLTEVQGVHLITGGPKDFRRNANEQGEGRRLRRDDGSVLHFSLTTRAKSEGLTMLAYDFELYSPSRSPVWFVRYDLNPIYHANSDDGLRCHFHPSDDDISLPAPWLTPCEALTLLIHGTRAGRATPRSPT